MSDANERAAAEREYYHQTREIREAVLGAVEDLREDLAQLLSRQSAERGSNDGERLWETLPFEGWWQLVITENTRDGYRRDADQVINFLKERI